VSEPGKPIALDQLREEDFARRRGERFRLRLPSGEALGLELVEVAGHPYLPPGPGRRRGFTVTFRSDRPGHLPQAIYPVEHDEMGTMELFLVPLGPRDGGMCYDAVFN